MLHIDFESGIQLSPYIYRKSLLRYIHFDLGFTMTLLYRFTPSQVISY